MRCYKCSKKSRLVNVPNSKEEVFYCKGCEIFYPARKKIDLTKKSKEDLISIVKHQEFFLLEAMKGWETTLNEWGFWSKLQFLMTLIAFLLGICWGLTW